MTLEQAKRMPLAIHDLLFLCDGKKCPVCNYSRCHVTKDFNHATGDASLIDIYRFPVGSNGIASIAFLGSTDVSKEISEVIPGEPIIIHNEKE